MKMSRLFAPLFLLVAAFAFASCEKKNDPAEAATAFFQQIGNGQLEEAYDSAAFGFKAQQNTKLFAQTAKEMALTEFASASWSAPEIEDRTAKVTGEVTTKNGAKIPLVLTLSDESDAWRIFSIKKPRDVETGVTANIFGAVGKGASFAGAVDRTLPPEPIVKDLVLETLLAFDDAIRAGSFEDFYAQTSKLWQGQLTVGQLQRTFQPFIDKKISLAGVRELEPVFDQPPEVNTEGLLIVSGYFPTKPYRVIFSLKYTYELPKWRLFGIDVKLQ